MYGHVGRGTLALCALLDLFSSAWHASMLTSCSCIFQVMPTSQPIFFLVCRSYDFEKFILQPTKSRLLHHQTLGRSRLISLYVSQQRTGFHHFRYLPFWLVILLGILRGLWCITASCNTTHPGLLLYVLGQPTHLLQYHESLPGSYRLLLQVARIHSQSRQHAPPSLPLHGYPQDTGCTSG